MAGWLGLLVGITLFNGCYFLPAELSEKKMYSRQQEQNVRSYLVTGNRQHLLNKPYMTIPLSDPQLLASILDDRGIRKILPYNLAQPLQPEKEIQADSNTHEAQWQYSYPIKGAVMRIPVTGFPLSEGIKIEIEQNGKREPLTVKANPGSAWDTITTRISDHKFTIHFTDKSATAWAAVGAPIATGSYDTLTNNLLAHYLLFLIPGITILICLILWKGFSKKLTRQ